ncbi:phosphotransferase [Dactylosporangium vinaceum]|uniref:Phosphotransferase n=1 Tax=Dactylosporangium vinaceum TaxID=53362 RepID=A0ABV5M1K9_9ACTN|nr:phosphotransferase [Dactylosporangium vinaceum]UAB99190.1 phosphotransferase [Dactylosporangium vinaceum]
MTEQRLPGGRTYGAVRVGDEVRRPAQPSTASVHAVLRHLENTGFAGAPRARGFDEQGRERVTFLEGRTLGDEGPTWPDFLRSDAALQQVGAWLRRLHDATATFEPPAGAVWFTGQAWAPGLVIAHLDAAPWNAVWDGDTLVGFADWELASPSPREGDLAFSALTWTPLLTAGITEPAGFKDPDDRRRRLHLFLDAYGYQGDRLVIRDAILGRVERNVGVIRHLASQGAPPFQQLLPWAADLEQSGAEVAALPDEFWRPQE